MSTPLALRVVEHQAQVFKRFWRGTLFGYVLNPLLYLAALGFGLGSLITENQGEVAGLPYVEFVAPGLMAAAAMQAAAADSLWPVMAGMKWIRVYHGMVATPLRPRDVYTGSITWTAMRAGLGATVFLVVAALLGAIPSVWGVLAVPSAALTAAGFAAVLAAFAATQEVDLRFPLIMRLGILPLFLLSGTFFPISQLPGWLQVCAWASPLWHGVELCRASTTGTLEPVDLAHLVFLVAFVWVGWCWGVRTFDRRLTA